MDLLEPDRAKLDTRSLLEQLGDGPAVVAVSLLRRGRIGTTSPTDCPVFHYLLDCGVPVRAVGLVQAIVRGGAGQPDIVIRLPDGVAAFVREFDAGGWPTLEAA